MAFWSGEKLLANPRVVSDFLESRLDVNAYNLRMGGSYFRTADADTKDVQKTITLSSQEYFVIPAGQFAFLLTKETVHVPANAMALISMRTHIKFKGLINVSGFHVDPGYEGQLVFGVYNAGPLPIQLREGDELFKIWFADLEHASSRLFEGKAVDSITTDMVSGMNKEIYSLQSLAQKIRDLEVAVDKKLADQKFSVETKLAEQKPTIDSLNFVWRTLVLGVVGAIILAVLINTWRIGQEVYDRVFPAVTVPPPSPPASGP